MTSLPLLVGMAVALGACGSAVSTDAAEPTTSLTISFRSAAGAAPVVTKLRCRPAGGTVVRPARACQRLEALPNAFAPTPKNVACTEIYGGPQTATVTGTYRGRALSTTFARRNGCEIERWSRHGFLFPATGSLGPS